jgi:hypothetical protein
MNIELVFRDRGEHRASEPARRRGGVDVLCDGVKLGPRRLDAIPQFEQMPRAPACTR